MIRIAISEAAFAAIARTLALASVGFENAVNEQGECYVWLEPKSTGSRPCVGRARATATSSYGWRGLLNAVATVPCHAS